MPKKLIITTSLTVDVLELVETAKEWESLSDDEKVEIASNYYDEHQSEGWSFDVDGDWNDDEYDEYDDDDDDDDDDDSDDELGG